MEKAVYRIIDANFNRAREALRVIEEFCRFSLNSKSLNSRLKDFRHKLCAEVGKLDQGKLLAARDTAGDVGTDIKVQNQIGRKRPEDSFTAACKRLPEALRALTEMMASVEPQAAAEIEKLRYQSYTLEKEITLSILPAGKFENVRLYVLITESEPERIYELTEQCCRGGADCVQLRCKNLVKTDKELLEIAQRFVEICRENEVISIINDRTDIAVLSDADGLHLGQDDISVQQARRLMSKPMIIGKSTHNLKQLKRAVDEGPTYVGIGPAFATQTKPQEKTAGLGYLETAVEILKDTGLYHTAIGGINLENIDQVLEKGVKTVAVCKEASNSADPAGICEKFSKILGK